MSLSDATTRNLRRRDKAYKVSEFGELFLEVKPTGSRLRQRKYWIDGKEKALSIRMSPEVSLGCARDVARTLLATASICSFEPDRQSKSGTALFLARNRAALVDKSNRVTRRSRGPFDLRFWVSKRSKSAGGVTKASLERCFYFQYLGNMEQITAIQSFATLGHPGRLAVFRLLMRFVPQGARPTEIAEALGLKQNTLSHHLSELARAGLICGNRQGRSLFYAVNLRAAEGLVSYLVHDCCRGRPDICPEPGTQTDKGMPRARYNVLFICSGNSARSIFAEAILNGSSGQKFRAFSAGTRPGTAPNPFALDLLNRNGMDTSDLRSKHISEFETASAPKMDFVFTVCNAAASEECRPWTGQPLTAHWGVADPVRATGSAAEKALAFATAFAELNGRIMAFSALSIENLDRLSLQHQLDAIGCDET